MTSRDDLFDPRHRDIRTFGRRDARKLSPRKSGLMKSLLPKLRPDLTDQGRVDPKAFFTDTLDEVWLEIGFGGGEHLIEQARRNARTGLVGVEPFIDGVAKALTGVEDHELRNVAIYDDDVRLLLPKLTAQSLDRVFILFPDPWPKRRQQKRRLIQTDFVDVLVQAMRPGARLRFATDVASYADEALWRLTAHPSLEWTAEASADWTAAPADHVATRYQEKQLGDCAPVYFQFVRL